MSGEASIFRDITASPESAKDVVCSVIRKPCSASPVEQRSLPFSPWWPLRSSGSTAVCSEVGECVEGTEFCHPSLRLSLIPCSLSRRHHRVTMVQPTSRSATELVRTLSDQDREGGGLVSRFFLVLKKPWWLDLAYLLLQSLPRSRLAGLRDRINPLLEFDILGVRSFYATEFFFTF
jgi:hypothetical protein